MRNICELHNRLRCAECEYVKELEDQVNHLLGELEKIKEEEWGLAGQPTPIYLIAHFAIEKIKRDRE